MKIAPLLAVLFYCSQLTAQSIRFANYDMKAVGVSMANVKLRGKEAMMAVKDSTIEGADQPTFIRIGGVAFRDGTIEVKVLSRLVKNAPEYSRGFIGIAFRINDSNTRFENIYLRPVNFTCSSLVRVIKKGYRNTIALDLKPDSVRKQKASKELDIAFKLSVGNDFNCCSEVACQSDRDYPIAGRSFGSSVICT